MAETGDLKVVVKCQSNGYRKGPTYNFVDTDYHFQFLELFKALNEYERAARSFAEFMKRKRGKRKISIEAQRSWTPSFMPRRSK